VTTAASLQLGTASGSTVSGYTVTLAVGVDTNSARA
jgi:hypothetical protein